LFTILSAFAHRFPFTKCSLFFYSSPLFSVHSLFTKRSLFVHSSPFFKRSSTVFRFVYNAFSIRSQITVLSAFVHSFPITKRSSFSFWLSSGTSVRKDVFSTWEKNDAFKGSNKLSYYIYEIWFWNVKAWDC
jgi:hypothetical protein